ncbi:Paraquat-inducible protein B [Caulifigura coniformis]|uniref:Paraquat-inducible protein B n=1 Tax=Caulifigura coniformis TaxID=2527983 RepID=A0A517S8Q6_9PLAN|nr:paraquat-inducible protein A [Caulifigura coniformis]QDT52492.1 Paraquat-inducible protein B [Caulifigura coniformis]
MHLAACHCCGLIQTLEGIAGRADCVRCETRLAHSETRRDNQPAAAAAAAALILYVPAVTLPFLRIERLGLFSDNSLLGGIAALFDEGHHFVGAVVLCFSVILPLLKLGALLTLSLRKNWVPQRHRAITYRIVEQLGRWGMLDVLLVAVMIAFVKLGNLVHFSAGPGLAMFASFVLVSIAASVLFDPHIMWHDSEPATPAPAATTPEPVPASIPKAKPSPPRPSWAWLIALFALVGAVAAWRSVQKEQGRLIEISFREGHGLRAGSELKHLGIAVGRVESLALSDNATSIDVAVRLTPQGESIARRGSQFWIVRPQVDLAGVRGLETVIGDKLLAVEPGPLDGPLTSRFVGLEEPPLPDAGIEGGLAIVFQATKADGLGPGVPVFYRGIRVGSILSTVLAGDGSAIEAQAVIRPEFRPLVRENAEFWNASGVSVEAALTSFRVQVGPVESWLRGRVEFAVPNTPGPEAKDGARFLLADRPDPEWLTWSPALTTGRSKAGFQRPPVERALLTWTSQSWFRTKAQSTAGWLLPVKEGYLGPRDLFPADLPTASLTFAGRTVELASATKVERGPEIVLLKTPDSPPLVATERTANQPEDGYLVAGNDAPVFIAAARMKVEKGRWTLDSAINLPDDWVGAAFVAASDRAVIGLFRSEDDTRWIAPLAR